MKPRKPKKCKACGDEFYPFQSTQKVCSHTCAIKLTAIDKARKAKQNTRALKKARNDADRAYQLKKAQAAFNAFIRLRDKGRGCISCGTTSNVQYAAGHFRTVGAAPGLRFNQFNVNLQCNRRCNKELSGNLLEYRIRLVKKFGVEIVEWLEGEHEPKKWTLEEIKAIKNYYKAMCKHLKGD